MGGGGSYQTIEPLLSWTQRERDCVLRFCRVGSIVAGSWNVEGFNVRVTGNVFKKMFLGLIFGTASIHLHDICSSQKKQASISLVNQYMSVRPDYISFSSLFSLMAAYIL